MDRWDEWDAISILLGGAQYNPRLQQKMADMWWSPFGLLTLFLFAAGTIVYCLAASK